MTDGLVRILDGNTFVVSDRRGDIEASATDPAGLFAWDTRFLSRWVLTVDGQRLTALSTDDLNFFETRFFLVPGTGTVYVNANLTVIRQRAVGDGFRESIILLEPPAEGSRPRDPDRRGLRLRRPLRGEGRARQARDVRDAGGGRDSGHLVRARHVPPGDHGLVLRTPGEGRRRRPGVRRADRTARVVDHRALRPDGHRATRRPGCPPRARGGLRHPPQPAGGAGRVALRRAPAGAIRGAAGRTPSMPITYC